MPIPITIPRLGWNMEEGTFLEWLKADGDAVRPGDVVFRLEGEKATEDVESLDAGTLHIPASGPAAGDQIAVGTVIGYLLQPGELPPDSGRTGGASPPPVTSSPSRQNEVRPVHEVAQEQASCPPSAPQEPRLTPRARRRAGQLGIDVASIRGSGRDGRIRERDVLAASTSSHRALDMTPIRRAIAVRMVESRQTTAPVTLTSVVDATNLVALRNQLKREATPAPTYTDLFVKLSAGALQQHPLLASRLTDTGIVPPETIDIGIAVDTDWGLLVPVTRNVPSLSLRELAQLSRELVDRARGGTLSAAEMRGGCFTITNLGGYGIDAFTPIINPPQCAVLGLGRITRQPVMDGERVVGREMITLSLTFDHRIVDGGPAARFLQTIARGIADPGPWLQLEDRR